MNTVKIVNDVRKTQEDLNKIFNFTKEDYSSLKPLNIPKKVINTLLKDTTLDSSPNGKYDTKYKWVGVKPDFIFSFNFHNKIKGKKETFTDVKKKLERPQDLNPKEIIEVLAIVSQTEKENDNLHMKVENKGNLIEIQETVVEVKKEKEITPPVNKNLLSEQALYDLVYETFNDPQKSPLLGLLGDIVKFLVENNETIEAIKNTQKTLIAIGKSNQANIFDIISSEYNSLREQYYVLKESGDEQTVLNYNSRLEWLEKSVKFLRQRIDSNDVVKVQNCLFITRFF
jgi:hypothetical protein